MKENLFKTDEMINDDSQTILRLTMSEDEIKVMISSLDWYLERKGDSLNQDKIKRFNEIKVNIKNNEKFSIKQEEINKIVEIYNTYNNMLKTLE
jgi:hypothetical protein